MTDPTDTWRATFAGSGQSTSAQLRQAQAALAASQADLTCAEAERDAAREMAKTLSDLHHGVLRELNERDLTYLSLFSGIGGLDLGLDRAGWTCVGQVEQDTWCRAVLDRHWPGVLKHDDVRTTPAWWAVGTRPAVRMVAGGYPCQPFSTAGLGGGTGDPRWGWPWFRDVVRAVRPEFVLVENVPALLDDADAFGWMLGDLAEDGFDADWTVLSACALGAPHTRERLFLVAYPAGSHGQHDLQIQAGLARGRTEPGGAGGSSWPAGWLPEPDVDRMADGVPKRLVAPQLRGLGNAVVPQVGELIGRLIREHAERPASVRGAR